MVQRRNTQQRALVLDAVRSRCDHPTADDIYLDVRARDSRISRGTVYRNLRVLEQEGQIQTVRMPSGDRFDLRCDDHAHAVCRKCGALVDVNIPYQPDLDEKVAQETGFSVESHRTIFDGLCPACQARAAAEQGESN